MTTKSRMSAAVMLTALLAFALVLVAGTARPVSAQDGSCPTAKDSYTIGFANLTEDIVFTQLVGESMQRAADAAGNVTLVTADNRLDGATALANADNFISQGVDAVVEFQTDEAFGNVIMSRFRREGIPVIAIDIPMPGATFFGADNYNAGLMAGEALGQWVNDNWDGSADNLLVLELPQSGPIPAARMQGMIDGIQGTVQTPLTDDQIIRLDSKNTQEEAFAVVSDTLPAIPDAEKILAVTINDGVALGVIAAAEAAGRGDQIMVVGQGADPSGQEEMLKENSRYLGATAYFPELYGDQIIPAMLDILNCVAVPPSVYVNHVFINKDNLCEYYAADWPDACPAS